MPETKTKILDAAARAFACRGFHRATIRQIAADARVNEVTVFRYFPEKSDLYWATVERKVRTSNLVSLVDEAVQSSRGPADLVFSTSKCLFRLLNEDRDLARLLHFTFLELDAEKRFLWDSLLRPVIEAINSHMRQWIADGQIREMNPETATRALLGNVITQHLFGVADGQTAGADRSEARATEQADLSLYGIIPR